MTVRIQQNELSVESKRQLLRALVDEHSHLLQDIAPDLAAAWLRDHALAGLGALCLRERVPSISAELDLDYYLILGENSVHDLLFKRALAALNSAEITPLLLKGISLIHGVYDDIASRTMSDIDLWIPRRQMPLAVEQLVGAGFTQNIEKESRPAALQTLSDGEIQIVAAEYPRNLIELQFAPVSGWWQKRTATIDFATMWQDSILDNIDGYPVRRLSAEDSIIQLAVHNVAQHQVSLYALRAFVDTAYIVCGSPIDWQKLVTKAQKWRVATVVWLHLNLTASILDLSGVESALAQLRPPHWQQRLLAKFISPELVLDTVNLEKGIPHFLFLLSLPDRLRDSSRLFFRALWPEKSWLNARYGAPRRWHHLWQIIRHQKI